MKRIWNNILVRIGLRKESFEIALFTYIDAAGNPVKWMTTQVRWLNKFIIKARTEEKAENIGLERAKQLYPNIIDCIRIF